MGEIYIEAKHPGRCLIDGHEQSKDIKRRKTLKWEPLEGIVMSLWNLYIQWQVPDSRPSPGQGFSWIRLRRIVKHPQRFSISRYRIPSPSLMILWLTSTDLQSSSSLDLIKVTSIDEHMTWMARMPLAWYQWRKNLCAAFWTRDVRIKNSATNANHRTQADAGWYRWPGW